jgi:DNA-binding beta-propeller fold protein YncE
MLVFLGATSLFAQKQVTLPNGWSLTPVGRSLPLGELPLNIVLSPSKKYAAVTNNGEFRQSIQLIDVKSEKILDNISIDWSWYGLAFSADEKYLYASEGNKNRILKYSIENTKLKLADSIKLGKQWPNKISPAGMVIDDERRLLFVVTREDNSLYVVDLQTKKTIKKLQLDAEAYTCLLSKNKNELYISCWGCRKLVVVDTKTFEISGQIAVGEHPNELCLSKKGDRLFVANASDNSVSVISLKHKKLIETLTASLYPDAPQGSTTNGLALSEDGKTLFIANADNNCLAVFDVADRGESEAKGFIPVGWYPTSVRIAGKKILVANGKGFTSLPNPGGPTPFRPKVKHAGGIDEDGPQYIARLLKGTMSVVDIPDEKQLALYSQQVYANTPYTKDKEKISEGEDGNPIPKKIGGPSPIKHVFYIVKENRTYDQVLGDMKEGNGDPSLVLFGEKYTPNLHKLAQEFVLLDNFYVDGEVSADGHNWSMGAYANDYLEKQWPTNYGDRGGEYAAEGGMKIANNKGDFIWGNCAKAGVSYRTYGEFADDYKANLPVLEGHFCKYYTSWDQTVRDTTRVAQWKRDFDSLVAINALPQLNTLRIINDHTEGTKKGRPTPFAHVADNDLAVGMFVEYLSKSPVWKNSVVFILEDDAQNGPDHVDAHRSTAYIAGPYVKRGFVDHSSYTTSGMIRTIELILGLPPMSQYDAAATPLWKCFTATPDNKGFSSLPSNVNLADKNIKADKLARLSEKFDFSKEDRAPDNAFNEVLWKAVKGVAAVMPAPKRAAFVRTKE